MNTLTLRVSYANRKILGDMQEHHRKETGEFISLDSVVSQLIALRAEIARLQDQLAEAIVIGMRGSERFNQTADWLEDSRKEVARLNAENGLLRATVESQVGIIGDYHTRCERLERENMRQSELIARLEGRLALADDLACADNFNMGTIRRRLEANEVPDLSECQWMAGRIDRQTMEIARLEADKRRLDWLGSQSPGMKWVARESTTGRGYRLHQDPTLGVHDSPREAIDAAMAQQEGK